MHKKFIALHCDGALGAGFASVAEAQKVGFCDYRRLTAEAPQSRDAMAAVQGEFQPKAKLLQGQQKEFEARVQKFQRDQATMADSEKSKVERELRDTEIGLARKEKELQEDFQLRQNEELRKIEALVLGEVEKVAKANGYDLIVRDAAYRSDNIDVTQQVLNSLQAKAKSAAPASAAPAPAGKPAGK
jgi:outer membrane protein